MRQHNPLIACLVGVCAFLGAFPAAAAAQRFVEVTAGLEGNVGRFGQLEETPFGFSGRFSVDFARRVSAELALIRFPEKRGGNFGERIWLAGGRVLVWSRDARLYARVRAGRIFFGGSIFETAFPTLHHDVYDLGATIEDDLNRYFVWRIEVGDMIIPLKGIEYTEAGPPRILKTTHNVMMSTGVAVRF